MQIKIFPLLSSHERHQSLLCVAHELEHTFPWPESPLYEIKMSVQKERIWLTWFGTLSVDQVRWLQTSPLVVRWQWSRGGNLSIANQIPTTQSHLGSFLYEHEEIVASLTLSSWRGPFLSLPSPQRYISISDDAHLQKILCDAKILATGWTQCIRLCLLCDAPGACLISDFCMACEEAYKAFFQPPPIGLEEEEELKKLLMERRFPLVYEIDSDEIETEIEREGQA